MAAHDTENDIATQLFEWASKEMHIQPPLPEVLRRICRGMHQTDIWQHVIKHIYSTQTVKKVRGNLLLKTMWAQPGYTVKFKSGEHYNDEKNDLLSRRAQLLGDIATVQSENHQLENELARLGSDIQRAEQEYQNEAEKIRDLTRKACLLRVFAQTCNQHTVSIDAYADRVQDKQDALVNKSTGVDKELHTRLDDGSDDEEDKPSNAELETTTTRDTREACKQIEKFLNQTLQGTFSKNKFSFKVNKDHVWKQVESTLREHKIKHVLESLMHLSKQGARTVIDHAAKVNIYKEAEKLRFKFEKGGVLTDIASEPTVLHSVHQLLEEKQLQHVMRFVETQKYQNETRPLLEHLEATRSKISMALQQYLANQPGTIEMANSLVQCHLDLVAESTAIDGYRHAGDQLRLSIAKGIESRDSLLSLHHTIQDFQQIANAKQNLIQVIAKQNSGAKSRLAAQHMEVSQYIARSIPSHHLDTQTLVDELKGAVSAELEAFLQLSMPYLVHIGLDGETKCGLLDLSVNHTSHPKAIRDRQSLQRTLQCLHFPMYKAPECILPFCMRLKHDKDEYETVLQDLERRMDSALRVSGLPTSIDLVPALRESVLQHDKAQLEQLLPILNKRFSKTARASTDCIRVKDCVQSWWDQPAQFLTPWVVKGDMSYQQWYHRWRVLVTRIRQCSIQQ